MLTALSVRDVVLIDRLELEFSGGLVVLTGETGAGKSILLDSLGLALGQRARASLVRSGQEKADVSAEFALPAGHPAWADLADHEIEADERLTLRRVLKADGGSRAWINGTPVPAALLKSVGERLIEIHGQHDDRGLLNARGHRQLLDQFCGNAAERAAVAAAWARVSAIEAELAEAEAAKAKADEDREFVALAIEELTAFDPKEGEETELADRRAAMLSGQKIADDLAAVVDDFSGSKGISASLRVAARNLGRIAEAHDDLGRALEAVDRALVELDEAERGLAAASEAVRYDEADLDHAEARLFDMRALARKYRTTPAALPGFLEELRGQREVADAGDARLGELRGELAAAAAELKTANNALTASRKAGGAALAKAVAGELVPLKLDAARFQVAVESLGKGQGGPGGADRVEFLISTNPGSDFGPLAKIASGGELSRFVLALKVALAAKGDAGTMIFDEIDRGVGGATASAIGERLSRLAGEAQVLVVTHSPQVAAAADGHFRIVKRADGGVTVTGIARLSADERREEIARMLSGADVTDEARAQAQRLLG
ncbi:MAG: DNA repair protein RecN [Pacificimonas sp.]|jgi:DNA repair protein RecN (Recombination protein N)|nr:DNA repair protein RecN [Pacificimonas sp.]